MPKSVLVVDDERHIARLVQVNLERQGYEVRIALTASAALRGIETGAPDLIILDVLLPGGSAFELLRALKKEPHTRNIPIVITSNPVTGNVFRDWKNSVDWLEWYGKNEDDNDETPQ